MLLPLLFFKWLETRGHDKEQSYWSAFLLMAFPHAYYFSMIYTESLFLLSGIAVLYFLEKEQWLLYGVACFILLPMYEGAATSQPRFISTAFPLFMVLGGKLSKIKTSFHKTMVTIIVVLLHFASFIAWNNTWPLSY